MEKKHGQGHGIAGRYLGLTDEFCEFSSSPIVVLPVAFDKTTTYQQGADQGPAAIIEASRNLELYDIETDTEVFLKGIHTLTEMRPKTSEEMIEELQEKVTALLQNKKFVVTLGGEHSISFAPIKAHSEFFDNVSILQFDAHADLQDQYEGNPWSHASVMARVLELPAVTKIVSVGIRSMSGEEKYNQKRTRTFFCHELFHNDFWMDEVVSSLSENIYITFDLDVFDSSLMSSTGTPEPGGLFWHQVTRLLKKVIEKKNLVGFDVVELCPNSYNKSCDFLAAKLVYKILSYKFGKYS